MNSVKIRKGKNCSIRVVNTSSQQEYISKNDAEMDARAKQAVKTAVAKAEFCKKPVARYDVETKKAYMDYANGERIYVN